MRFLADESCDYAVVRSLRTAGHDVLAVCELSPGIEDLEVMEQALREKRILLTEDKDFGQLVFSAWQDTFGVIFLRYPPSVRQRISKELVTLVKRYGEKLVGCFIVVQPGRVRITHP